MRIAVKSLQPGPLGSPPHGSEGGEMAIGFRTNGHTVNFDAASETPPLSVIREQLKLTGRS